MLKFQSLIVEIGGLWVIGCGLGPGHEGKEALFKFGIAASHEFQLKKNIGVNRVKTYEMDPFHIFIFSILWEGDT
jgi:hypothetical protein